MDTAIVDPRRRTPLTSPFLPAKSRANWCTLFLLLHGIIVIASMASTMAEIGMLQRIEAGEFVSPAETASNDGRQATIGFLYLLTFVAAGIAFLIWIYRTSKNLGPLGWQNQRFSPGWAVGWWFIPIMWLFMPYQVMKEIWKSSLPASLPETSGAPVDPSTTPLLGPWWAAFLLSAFVAAIPLAINFSDAQTTSDLIAAGYAAVVSDLVALVSLVLIVMLIWQITVNQEKSHTEQRRSKETVVWPGA